MPHAKPRRAQRLERVMNFCVLGSRETRVVLKGRELVAGGGAKRNHRNIVSKRREPRQGREKWRLALGRALPHSAFRVPSFLRSALLPQRHPDKPGVLLLDELFAPL